MQEKGQAEVCPFCGYREGTPPQAPHYLAPGTVLAGKYLVGRGLGHGGFGTTYIARDQVLGVKLAIKEYLPQDCASRAPGSNLVVPFSGEGAKRFADGLESFLQEARTLARFDGSPNIVGVRDFFTENGTAYLVMNYLEGITLKQYLVRSGGKPVPFNKMLGILLPVMDALKTVHDAGLLHRDISPDNIFLTTSGQVTLIDFGAARQSMSVQQSMSVILKPGYAPEEQYRSHGHQGPWTDIYALGATMYRTLTGKIPPEALERLTHECLLPPSRLGVSLPADAEAAILRAMAVRAEERFQSIGDFRAALLSGSPSVQTPRPPVAQKSKPRQQKRKEAQQPARKPSRRHKKKAGVRPATVVLTAILLAATGLGLLFFYYITRVMGQTPSPSVSHIPMETADVLDYTPVPTAVPTQAPTPSYSPTPEPTPTPTPVDPALLPFLEGSVPEESLSSFVPAPNRVMVVEDAGIRTTWITGRAPMSRPDLIAARFVYDVNNREPSGGLYGYYLDGAGNLRYTSIEEGGSDVLVLPANCAVGMRFNGMLGACRVYAVNYSGMAGDMQVSDSIVIACGDGYAFYQSGKGLMLIQTEFDGGTVIYRIVSDAADHEGIYASFVE